ncbi:MAG: NAD(P)/FAD-dependent oxidoreductase [Clostridia bacterium]|nr:NAD(P)/FAD-dependent oxidoreductase [Clostridia bacterium]
MTAAIFAAENGAEVTLFERNGRDRLGRKLGITGKGRCNLTNECGINPRFLYSAFNFCSPADVMSWFEGMGVPLKVERGRRVFPVSDKATDIVLTLKSRILALGIKIEGATVTSVEHDGEEFSVVHSKGCDPFEKVIIATGGKSYQTTGSDGLGYGLAEELGHTVTPLRASLVPLVCKGELCRSMMGLSLKNIAFSVRDNRTGGIVYEDFGEMLFTHFGMSGPVVLSASAVIGEGLTADRYTALIDLKPALDRKMLDSRLLSEFSQNPNRNYSNSLSSLLPQKMIQPFAVKSGISPDKKVNSVTREERERIIDLLKCFDIPITGLRPIDEAIVTSGGVSVKEISPKNMESKLVPGLYFAGEIIDVDAYTGGYNLQIAWSTGRLAGAAAAQSLKGI